MAFFKRIVDEYAADLRSRREENLAGRENLSDPRGGPDLGSSDEESLNPPVGHASAENEIREDAGEQQDPEQLFLELTDAEADNDEQFHRERPPLPPLSRGSARIIAIEDGNGEQVPAMILTDQMIREWNIIIKCSRRASDYRYKLRVLRMKFDRFEERKGKLKARKEELREEHHDLSDEEFASLETVHALRAKFEQLDITSTELLEQMEKYKEKLVREEDAPKTTRSWMEKYWSFVLADNNLLEPDSHSDASDEEYGQHQAAQEEVYYPAENVEPTPSEIATQEFCNQMQETSERIAELQEEVNNWKEHYDSELMQYLAAVEEGTCENSRTVFDLCLLEESQEKIGALIKAEKEYETALVEARKMGLVSEEGSFGSPTPSMAEDDGYRLSFEDEMSASIDKRWILSWVAGIEGRNTNLEPDCDDWNEWEVKSLAQNERDSVKYEMMARGSRRKNIDKWRSICESLKPPGISIPARSFTLGSISSPEGPSAESGPFITSPISSMSGQSEGSRRFSRATPLPSPLTNPFATPPITPAGFRTFELGVRRGIRLSPMEALSPLGDPGLLRRQDSPQMYGPFSPIDIQEDLYQGESPQEKPDEGAVHGKKAPSRPI